MDLETEAARSSSSISSVDKAQANPKLRKIADFQVLPLLLVAFASYQLDRTNVSSALTGGFASSISVDQNTINIGNQLMFLGVIILEIPSNVILHRKQVGPRFWIGGQVLIFGIIAAAQIFIRDRTGFLVTRTILGLAEAGFIPGAMFTLSQWYSTEEITRRIAIFFFGMFGGTAVGPLFGAGLLRLDGRGNLSGWQWIFLVEGLWTIVVSIVLLTFLPERDKYEKPCEEDESSGREKSPTPKIPTKVIFATLFNISKWPHFLATASVFATWSPLTTYTPSIVMGLGFSRVQANALAAIGNFLTLPVVFFFAWLSDRTRKRGITVMVAILTYLIALICLRTIQSHVDNWSKFGLWTTTNALAVGYHPVHNAWIQMNSKSPEERIVMTATAGLMAGTQIFREEDSDKLYPNGLLTMIGLVILGLILTGLQEFIYYVQNRKAERHGNHTALNIL
ncbi:hypothetical protein VI817_009282 [Penicillium citrinum]|nr:hypothetical protein VI817_009282 [Penicillium citrinum]